MVYVSLRGRRSRWPGDQQTCAKTAKGLENEKCLGKEKEPVMAADELIVGIDDSPSARAAFPLGQLRTPDRSEQRFAPFKSSTSRRHKTCTSIP